MKVLFIGKYYHFENNPIMYLSGYLMKHGHECYYLDLKFENNIIKEVKKIAPSVIAYNLVSGFGKPFIEINSALKKELDFFSVFGGPHCTLFPEFINNKDIDAVCLGDGEIALLELVNGLEKNEDIRFIKSFWIKIKGKVYENEIRKSVANIDEISYPERSIFDKYNHYYKLKRRGVITTRGCPFNCSYCYSNALKKIMGINAGVRQRSVENVITELAFVKKTYSPRKLKFFDDTLIFNKKWALSFLDKYEKKIGIPFSACVRLDLLDEEIIKALKKAGCFVVEFGIECGDEEMRTNLLKRKMPNEKIISGSLLLKKYGIKTMSLNMIGLPGETIDQCILTLKLNIKCKITYPHTSIYMPFPKTELGDYAIKAGLFDGNNDKIDYKFMYAKSLLKSKDHKKFKRLQYLFSIMTVFPFLLPLLRFLIKLPFRKFYQFLFFTHRVINHFFITKQHLISDFLIIPGKSKEIC